MNPALIELIILAGIAVFLFLRLRSVLGTREGFEKPRMQPKNDAPKRDFKVIDGGEDKDITDNVDKNSKSAEALKLIKSEDENFTVNEFLSGARSAYEWILMSFEKNEIDIVQTEEKTPKEKDIIYEKEQPRNANNKLIVIAGLIVSAIDITNSTSFSAGALIAIIANFL